MKATCDNSIYGYSLSNWRRLTPSLFSTHTPFVVKAKAYASMRQKYELPCECVFSRTLQAVSAIRTIVEDEYFAHPLRSHFPALGTIISNLP